MKTYSIEIKDILSLIDREISRAAAAAYGEDGTPLYDVVKTTSRDKEIIDNMVSLRMVQLTKKLRFAHAGFTKKNVTDQQNNTQTEAYDLSLSLSDGFKSEMLPSVITLVENYLAKGVSFDWFKKKGIVTATVDENEVLMIEDDIISFLRTPNYLKAPLQPFGPKKSLI